MKSKFTKTDKQGKWAFHSLDGWYLNNSPEHYRVHNCHIKSTRAERLTNTIHFKHKNNTNPTISHSDKLMNALANCKAILKGKMANNSNHTLAELNTLVHQVAEKLHIPQVPRVEREQPVPRVDITPVPRVPTPQNQPREQLPTTNPIATHTPPLARGASSTPTHSCPPQTSARQSTNSTSKSTSTQHEIMS